MAQLYKRLLFAAAFFVSGKTIAQTNAGTEFWVAYGHHQYMEPASCSSSGDGTNDMNMKLYLSNPGTQTATVSVIIDSSGLPTFFGSWYVKYYTVAPNTVIETENLPKGSVNASASASNASFDARLFSVPPPLGSASMGIFTKKGIHIESDQPIVVYSHIYGGVSSGATMLLPVNAWGDNYATINSEQGNSINSFSWMYVIASENSTTVEITPSQMGRLGQPAGVPIQVTLHRGHIYQFLGTSECTTGNGTQLTGTKVRSLGGKKIAVFAGSSRTGGEATICGASGRDNDMQQCFPKSSWGTKYLTAPASKSSNGTLQPTQLQTNVYKVLVNDPTTVVKRNGVVLTSFTNSLYYIFSSSTADYIEADKPIMLAMFMSNGAACNTGDGDPEMIYLSPIEQAVKNATFYRTNLQAILSNYVTLVVPTAGLASLKIDNVSTFSHTYTHPNKADYTVVVKGWAASKAQSVIVCDSPFTGYTYGMGGAESYGYNLGASFATINNIVPVSLTDFSASKIQNDVVANWKAVDETNFDRFEIERSLNGSDFAKAGTVAANKAGLYSFNDKNAAKDFASSKILYYRLKMMDKDGSFKYSSIAAVKLDKNLASQVSVYPNPFTSEIKVRINSLSAGMANISIKDLSGRTVETKTVFIPQGSNLVSFDNLANLNKGIYVLSVEMNGSKEHFKLTK